MFIGRGHLIFVECQRKNKMHHKSVLINMEKDISNNFVLNLRLQIHPIYRWLSKGQTNIKKLAFTTKLKLSKNWPLTPRINSLFRYCESTVFFLLTLNFQFGETFLPVHHSYLTYLNAKREIIDL